MPAIEPHDIVKTIGSVRALDGLHLSFEPGEVHGFLGPNGAGKSTAIRVLLGPLMADSGNATLLGGDPGRNAAELHRRMPNCSARPCSAVTPPRWQVCATECPPRC